MTLTPKEKAKELIEHFAEIVPPKTYGVIMERDWKTAKKCALIAVDEIMVLVREICKAFDVEPDDYWVKVKEEIIAY